MPNDWQPIAEARSGELLIGLIDNGPGGRPKVIVGELYDMQPNSLIDRQAGRWATCTHWIPAPTETIG
jgi:hypothetical protein